MRTWTSRPSPASRLAGRNAALQGEEIVEASQLLGARDIVLHLVGGEGSGPRRVHREVHYIELDLLELGAWYS